MKVLLINKYHYVKGGSERYYFAVAEALKRRGHEVVFLSMKDDKNLPCEQASFFVSNNSTEGNLLSKVRLLSHIAYSKEAFKKTTLLCEKEKPDFVVLNLIHKQLTCSVIDAIKKYNPKIPIFWTMHDLICVCPVYTMLDSKCCICEKCLNGDFSNCVKNKCVRGSKLLSTFSAYEANQIKKHGWYNLVNTFICPSNFYRKKLTEAHFTNSNIVWMRNPLPITTKYELNDYDKGYILYFGRLSREKGIKQLIDCTKNSSITLKIIGKGPLEKELKDYIKCEKITNVEMLGFKSGDELANYIKNCRCVVLPSQWYENGPYSVMEAMAYGKPIIVSSLGGLPELVENGQNGFVFQNIEGLRICIERMANLTKEEYKKMCKNSLEKAKEWFDPNKYVDDLLEMVKS